MALPPIASVPPLNIRLSLGPKEWEACLDAWLELAQLYLQLPAKSFRDSMSTPGSLVLFLNSYYHELSTTSAENDFLKGSAKSQRLSRLSFRLAHRIGAESKSDNEVLGWELLVNICHAYARSSAVATFMRSLWELQRPALEKLLQKKKASLTTLLESSNQNAIDEDLRQLASLMLASPDVAVLFMTGSDFLDAIVSAHGKNAQSTENRRALLSTVFICLTQIIKASPPNTSLLSDHLYSLKSYADRPKAGPITLLADTVTNTPLILTLRRDLSGKAPERLSKLLDVADAYRQPSIKLQHSRSRRRGTKRKAKQPQANGELHVHQMSLVSQIQDLFPDLGSAFILRLLEEYKDDVEQATAHLLDDSLPPHLQNLDRSEQAPSIDANQQRDIDQLVPKSTPPPSPPQPSAPEPFVPERRNIFDDDELDNLAMGTDRLHIGKRENRAPSDHQPNNKAAILSALAAFDSDDDERDDTYDVDDVGGTVDTTNPDGEPIAPSSSTAATAAKRDEIDMTLFAAYRSHPELFGRTFDVRRGQARLEMKRETGMTDEAIEGWAIMLQRDPRRLQKLESRATNSFDGRQTALDSTAYRGSAPGTDTEGDSDAPRGGFRGRGRGRGGRGGSRGGGRGGSVAGPSGDAATVAAQRNKEANKGRRANHNRRDQRARKMARGGFPG